MAELLKGKAVADALTEQNIKTVETLKTAGVEPTLAIVRIGENPSDMSYERGALKRAEKTGVTVKQFIYDETIDQKSFLAEIEKINRDDSIHGVLIFRPLPKHISDEAVRNTLVPEKDVDGITDGSLAGIFTGSHRGFAPCTARACMEIAAYNGIDFTGKKVAVLGRSLVIGKPVAMMAMEQNATVTTCHSRTGAEEMKKICRESDIIIAAMGRAKMVNAEYAGDDGSGYDQTLMGVFEGDGCVCAGYARAYKYLCDRAGIPCWYVVGSTDSDRDATHAWNVVSVEDAGTMFVDATWGDEGEAVSWLWYTGDRRMFDEHHIAMSMDLDDVVVASLKDSASPARAA